MGIKSKITCHLGKNILKKYFHRFIVICFLTWGAVTALPAPAWAYLDPNTGNLIFQALLPIITFFLTAFLLFKRATLKLLHSLRDRIKKWFSSPKSEDSKSQCSKSE